MADERASKLRRFHDHALDVTAASACVMVAALAMCLYGAAHPSPIADVALVVALACVPVVSVSLSALVASNLLIAYKES